MWYYVDVVSAATVTGPQVHPDGEPRDELRLLLCVLQVLRLAQRAWSLRTIRLRPRLFVARAMRAWRNAVRGPRRESSTSRADRRVAMRTAQLQATRRLRKGKQLQR
jgi:hypothetical protein